MLKKQFRLRKQKDFENIFRKGAYFSCDFLILKVAENDFSILRVGFIVSKKVSTKAFRRNKIKRLMRESVKLIQKDIKPRYDYVFIAKPDVIGKNFKEISSVVEKLFKKSGLLKKNN